MRQLVSAHWKLIENCLLIKSISDDSLWTYLYDIYSETSFQFINLDRCVLSEARAVCVDKSHWQTAHHGIVTDLYSRELSSYHRNVDIHMENKMNCTIWVYL